ncbi:unnamed protein product [Tenebrio molitor]|nr:unnamed protein product [Tenebrio molitor]
MKVSRVTRDPYLWHNITLTDDINLKNSFLLQQKKLLPSFIWPQQYIGTLRVKVKILGYWLP